MSCPRAVGDVPLPVGRPCFFLDFDGTLIDFAPTPDTIAVPEGLVALLGALRDRHADAVAIVTGRALPDIDRHLAPLRLPTAAWHGAVRRDVTGHLCGDTAADHFHVMTAPLRDCLRPWTASHPALLLEDKGIALAVHFRALPWNPGERQALQQTLQQALAAALPEACELLVGDQVLEIRRAGTDKGSAVAEFLKEAPFAGRFPVYLGDDLADIPGMTAVEKVGGLAIAVGDRLPARWRLPSPAAARAWLAGCLQGGGR